MSIFFISAEVDGNSIKYMLDTTSRVQVTRSGRLTKFPVQEGSDLADNYINENVVITFSGKVSDIKASRNPLYRSNFPGRKSPAPFITDEAGVLLPATAKEYLFQIETLKDKKIPFTLHAGENGGPYTNCLFTRFTSSQDSSTGTLNTGGEVISAFQVNFTVEQLRFGKRAAETTVRDAAVKNDFSEKKTKAGTKQEVSPTNLEIVQKAYDAGGFRGF